MMVDRFRPFGAVLFLALACAAHAAQTCRSDIPATAPDSRFTDNGNATVSDSATGLVWKQCAEGLSGSGCATGTAEAFTWQQALQRAADASFAGQTDWRLPNKNELESLVERRCVSPAINARFFPNTPSAASWSSSPYASGPVFAWTVRFDGGGVGGSVSGSADGYVRLVRAGQ